MTPGGDMAAVAALVGDPGRPNMLALMLDSRAHTAGELTRIAGVAAPTASGHLAKLERGRLVSVVPEGRHRYYRLASPEVAHMLEGLMVVAAEPRPAWRRATARMDEGLRRARTCYDHLAGELGAAFLDRALAIGLVRRRDGSRALDVVGSSDDVLRRLGFA